MGDVTEWRRELYSIIVDGKWHDRERLIRHISRYVPPNRAYRHGESLRRRMLKGPDRGRTKGDQRDSIRVGARDLARQAIRECERRETPDGPQLRAVGDFLRRVRAHQRLNPPPPPENTVTLMPHPGSVLAGKLDCCCPEDQDDVAPYALVDVGCPLHGWTLEPMDPADE